MSQRLLWFYVLLIYRFGKLQTVYSLLLTRPLNLAWILARNSISYLENGCGWVNSKTRLGV